MKMLRYLNDIADMLYPRICPGCGFPLQQKEDFICLYCRYKLPKTGFYSAKSNPVENLFKGRVNLCQADAWLYFRKKGLSQKLMHELKYKGKQELGLQLGKWYGRDWIQKQKGSVPQLITSVPLHVKKYTLRGYNQSEILARGFSETSGIPLKIGLLSRAIHSESQTKRKRYERWENSVDSFEFNHKYGKIEEHIALMDDVITTGATLEACARVLLENGVKKVSVFSLCLAIN